MKTAILAAALVLASCAANAQTQWLLIGAVLVLPDKSRENLYFPTRELCEATRQRVAIPKEETECVQIRSDR